MHPTNDTDSSDFAGADDGTDPAVPREIPPDADTDNYTDTDAGAEHSMGIDDSLSIAYVRHRRINEMVDAIRYCLEDLSLGFDRWEEPQIRGPGFYITIVSGTSVEAYADRMGTNHWPTEICRNVFGNADRFYEAASQVALDADGAVIASIDGVIQRQMVRLKDLSHTDLEARLGEPMPYADWMGSRHMSALDTSVREDVVATLTLSEETGRVTVFSDGEFESVERAAIGGRWRVNE